MEELLKIISEEMNNSITTCKETYWYSSYINDILNKLHEITLTKNQELNEYKIILDIISKNSTDEFIKNLSKEVLEKYKNN